MPSGTVIVNLARVRENALAIMQRTGVDLIGVVKADAYGLGAVAIADAIGDLVSGWYVLHPMEAVAARLWDVSGKPTLAAVPLEEDSVELLQSNGIRPGVWTLEQAICYRAAGPVLSVDTGMQRFAAGEADVEAILKFMPIDEAFTHAIRPEQVQLLRDRTAGRVPKLHAAGTALIGDASCHLNAVRPGFSMYGDAVRVSIPLVDARESTGPAGYTGFSSPRHGVVLAGYSHGLRCGPCLVNGRPQRVLEVGMQTSFVSLDAGDATGDEVVLLGDGLLPRAVAEAWKTSPHEVLLRLAGLGDRSYIS